MIAVRPNVASSEFSGDTRKRASSHCTTMPIAKNTGTISASVSSGSTWPTLASW
jgi:hypothetical protein